MRVYGNWLPCDDGVIRPIVLGLVRVNDEDWVEVPFLLDAGADRTVFSARFYGLLDHLQTNEPDQIRLAGIGGPADSITIKTAVGLRRDDGRMVTVQGSFGVFATSETADLSVLGRDVTNNFGVIYDYPKQAVILLAPPHHYEIKTFVN